MSKQEEAYLDKLQNDLRDSKLQEIVGGVNFFELTGMRTLEVKHSQFLKQLFDVDSNHGLGTAIVQGFLEKIDDLNLPADFYRNLRTETEKVFSNNKRIDILLYSQDTVVLIENKVFADERKGDEESEEGAMTVTLKGQKTWQLQDYVDGLADDNNLNCKPNKHYIYLTPEGKAPKCPSADKWKTAKYTMIIDVINETLKSNAVNSEMKTILEHYIKIIRRFIAVDKETKEKCQKICADNKEAIDLIIKFKSETTKRIAKDIHNLLQEREKSGIGIRVLKKAGMICRFKTDNMNRILGENKNPITYEIAPEVSKFSEFAWLSRPDSNDDKLRQIVGAETYDIAKKEIKNEKRILKGNKFCNVDENIGEDELGIAIDKFIKRIAIIEAEAEAKLTLKIK